MTEKKQAAARAFFVDMGVDEYHEYPCWRYHEFFPPRKCKDEQEVKEAEAQGWKDPSTPLTAVPYLPNWFSDLEDMNARQLSLFAQEEFGVVFPPDASEERLLQAMWELIHSAPQMKGRIALLAQSVEMNYDETVKQILRHSEDFEIVEKREVTI